MANGDSWHERNPSSSSVPDAIALASKIDFDYSSLSRGLSSLLELRSRQAFAQVDASTRPRMESNMKRTALILIGIGFATVGAGCCGTACGTRPFASAYSSNVSYPTYATQSYATPYQAVSPYQTTAAACNCAPN